MKPHIATKLIDQGKEILLPFVDVSGEGWKGKVESEGESDPHSITFTNASKKSIVISEVWFDNRTGKILQYGSNYGMLVL